MPEPLATSIALIVVAFGGYFVGGVANNLMEGESIMRMFSGSTEEQLIQLLFAGIMVGIAWMAV